MLAERWSIARGCPERLCSLFLRHLEKIPGHGAAGYPAWAFFLLQQGLKHMGTEVIPTPAIWESVKAPGPPCRSLACELMEENILTQAASAAFPVLSFPFKVLQIQTSTDLVLSGVSLPRANPDLPCWFLSPLHLNQIPS